MFIFRRSFILVSYFSLQKQFISCIDPALFLSRFATVSDWLYKKYRTSCLGRIKFFGICLWEKSSWSKIAICTPTSMLDCFGFSVLSKFLQNNKKKTSSLLADLTLYCHITLFSKQLPFKWHWFIALQLQVGLNFEDG